MRQHLGFTGYSAHPYLTVYSHWMESAMHITCWGHGFWFHCLAEQQMTVSAITLGRLIGLFCSTEFYTATLQNTSDRSLGCPTFRGDHHCDMHHPIICQVPTNNVSPHTASKRLIHLLTYTTSYLQITQNDQRGRSSKSTEYVCTVISGLDKLCHELLHINEIHCSFMDVTHS